MQHRWNTLGSQGFTAAPESYVQTLPGGYRDGLWLTLSPSAAPFLAHLGRSPAVGLLGSTVPGALYGFANGAWTKRLDLPAEMGLRCRVAASAAGHACAVWSNTTLQDVGDGESINIVPGMLNVKCTSPANVGPPTTYAGAVTDLFDVAMDASGRPYVAYQDNSGPPFAITVLRFTGTAWAGVGPRAASANYCGPTFCALRLAVGPDANPVLAYTDGATGGGLTVQRFSGSSWAYLGAAGFIAGGATGLEVWWCGLVIDSNRNPIVVTIARDPLQPDWSTARAELTSKRWSSSGGWATLAPFYPEGIPTEWLPISASLELASGTTPVLAMRRLLLPSYTSLVTVLRFVAASTSGSSAVLGSWEVRGTVEVPYHSVAATIETLELAIDANASAPVIGFADPYASDKGTVLRW